MPSGAGGAPGMGDGQRPGEACQQACMEHKTKCLFLSFVARHNARERPWKNRCVTERSGENAAAVTQAPPLRSETRWLWAVPALSRRRARGHCRQSPA